MTHNTDYTSVDIPEGKPPAEYHYTERRAELLQLIERAGSPARMNQSELAERYGVTQSQISKDLDRLGEFVDDALGQRATLATRALHERVITDLLETDDWRATKAAWDVQQEWNDWLADMGEQHREPDQHQHEHEVEARRTEVAYTVVREEPALPTDDAGGVDYDGLGFTSAPGTTIEVEETGDGADPQGGDDRR